MTGRPVFLAGAILLLVSPAASWAQSPLVEEVRRFEARYHENLPRLDSIREELERAVKTDGHLENFLALTQVCFIWGDVRAATPEQRLQAYECGERAARRAIELDRNSAAAHFWYGTHMGRWGQAKGVLRSLFLLPAIWDEIQTVLSLDPKFTAVYLLAGNVYYEVPRFFGGDLEKAEEMFRKGLAQDPTFTGMRVGLAKALIKMGRTAEARRELQTVLNERAPRNLADWTLKDSKDARELLESLRVSRPSP
jgi:tetratricopeptide (TPR) repeat protein